MARASLKLVGAEASGAPPQEPPAPVLTGRMITHTEAERHAWSALRTAYERVRPTFDGICTTDTKKADAAADLDALIAHAQALRSAL